MMTPQDVERAAHKLVGLWIEQCNVDEWAETEDPQDLEAITEACERIGADHLARAGYTRPQRQPIVLPEWE